MKKLLAIIIFITLLLLTNYFGFIYYFNKTIHLIDVYVASHNIEGRHLIVEEDLNIIKIPAKYALNSINNKDELIGKYTDIQGKIPAGSPFYSSMIFDKKDLPDNPITQLLENEVAFTILSDIAGLSGNSIVPGMRINVFGSINLGQNKIIEDKILDNVRVISIKDSKGYSLDHPSSNKIPHTITIAIPDESLSILSLTNKIGKIEMYATSDSYNFSTAKIYQDSKLIKYFNNEYNDETIDIK